MNISQQKSNFNTNVDRFSPLPAHWESHTDIFGRMLYVEHDTRKTTWTKPLSNPAVGVSGTVPHSQWLIGTVGIGFRS